MKRSLFWIPYAVAGVTNLLALAVGAESVAAVAQAMLMPALALTVLGSGVRTRATAWLLVAIAASWLGDSLPKLAGHLSFVAMVGGFLLAQFAYIIALAPRWRRSFVRKPVALLPYLAVIGALIALCAPNAGPMLVPLLVYAAALMAMSVLASGYGSLGTVGGALFLISDSLIALTTFSDLAFPWRGPLIMFTYIVGQGLLALAVIRGERAERTK